MDTEHLITGKIDRLRRGEKPRLLDLFSGCGGMTLGFVRAGCESVGGVELNPSAARTFAHNFHADAEGVHSCPRDITRWSPTELGAELGIDDLPSGVDVLIGGPPCPTFSRIGRAKLNYRKHEEPLARSGPIQPELFEGGSSPPSKTGYQLAGAHLEDPRNELFRRFVDYVRDLMPLAVVMENVPEFLNQAGTNHGEIAAGLLDECGYDVAYTLLNAAAYGVPQWRERFFLIAVHRSVGGAARDAIPVPGTTAELSMPRGLRSNRRAALKLLGHGGRDHEQQERLFPSDRWASAPGAPPGSPGVVTAADALEDLPAYRAHMDAAAPKGPPRADGYCVYSKPAHSPFSAQMRTWPGFESPTGFPARHHQTRHTTVETHRDINIFREMRPGDGYREAFRIALANYEREVGRLQGSGPDLTDEEKEQVHKNTVPPYPNDKFPNKWGKLNLDAPSWTLTAHLGKDSYSHIHYDSDQARMITIQEAARLQSFPDGFEFRGNLGEAFTQIGNSVPPLLSLAIAESVLKVIRGSKAPGPS